MMRPILSISLLHLIVFVSCLNHLSLATPRPRPKALKTAPTASYRVETFGQLHQLQRISYPLSNDSIGVEKRVIQNGLDLLTADWVGFFEQVSTFMPIQDATAQLSHVYHEVFEECLESYIANDPETDALSMVNGWLRLDFLGENGATIPWLFVQTFVAKLGHATQQGFTGSYRAYYKNPVTGIAVAVALSLILPLAPAAK